MLHIDVILYVLLIDFLAIMSPGPDFFMIFKTALTDSKLAAAYVTIGIVVSSGCIFLMGIFGIGILVTNNPYLLKFISYSGACYLIYLAIKAMMFKPSDDKVINITKDTTNHSINKLQYFVSGLLCNATNPKAFMFVVALSAYVANNGNIYTDGVCVVIGSVIISILWFFLVIIIFGHRLVQERFYRYQKIIHIIFAIVLLLVAYNIIIIFQK